MFYAVGRCQSTLRPQGMTVRPRRSASVGLVRWDELFADLEGRARALESQQRAAEIADRIRGENAQVALVNRLRRHLGAPLRLLVTGAGELAGVVTRVGPDHVLLDGDRPGESESLVALLAVASVWDLSTEAVSPDSVGAVEARLGLASVLRGVAADRSAVTVVLREGSRLHGTLGRVGQDWCEVAEHEIGEVARPGNLHGRRTVPLTALASLHRQPSW